MISISNQQTTYEKLQSLQDSCDTDEAVAELHKDLIMKAISTCNDDVEVAITAEFENLGESEG